ncbi:MAG: Stk1 family PASTA domain-containing Ser/Thr kinase, partial [Nocardioidaceae bacterium]
MTEPTQGPPMGADQAGRLGDRYEVGGLLGRGGMADVRVGRDIRLGRTVAIKRLRNDLASDPTFQARFRREAQSAASLNHPSIVAVYDTGEELGPDGQGVPFIVMELVEGQTLRDALREDRKIMPQRSLDITADVLGALDYSHRAGIVHRDIKPANVMLTPSGQVKVMDFGIARAIADSSSAMTQTAAVVGTAQYLSPEQARGEQVDARSDIYSTGCLLFELLTGRPPFVGDSPVSVAYQHVREEPVAPSTLNPEVTPGMDAVVLRALAKRTEDRYQSAAEMRSDIERVLAGLEVNAPTTTVPQQTAPVAVGAPADGTTTLPAATGGPPPGPAEERPRRRRWLWILVVLIVLAIIGGAAYAFRGELGLGGDDSSGPGTVTVPTTIVGQEMPVVRESLEKANLEVGDRSRDYSAEYDKGTVIESTPGAGEEAEEGSEVDLVISKGPELVEVPRIVGLQIEQAAERLDDLKIVYNEEEAIDSNKPEGEVVKVDPKVGEEVDPVIDQVDVYVSTGYKTFPDVEGLPLARAERLIERRGFDPDGITTDEDP